MSTHSKACCSLPPVVVKDYAIKGHYEEIDGRRTYVTGPESATKNILVITDIFGFHPQTLQGADLIAFNDGKQQYRIYMPDWFGGQPIMLERFPPKTPEERAELNAFFDKHHPTKMTDKVVSFVQKTQEKLTEAGAANKDGPWGLLGYCWGGKVATLVSGADAEAAAASPFKAVSAAHPAFVDLEDAPKVRVPICMLASRDESDSCKAFEARLTVPHVMECFDDQIHGWMAARGNLEDEKVRTEYLRGYSLLIKFFAEYV